jgi:hypothetical protein
MRLKDLLWTRAHYPPPPPMNHFEIGFNTPTAVVFVIIACAIGYYVTGGKLPSDKEGSDADGDVSFKDNPGLFGGTNRHNGIGGGS